MEIEQLVEITMSGVDGAQLLDAIRRLKAGAAALREALEEIKEEAEGDFDRDIILTACNSALAIDAGRSFLEQLRRAEAERDEALRALFEAGQIVMDKANR